MVGTNRTPPEAERYLSIRRLRPSERRINKARGGNVNDFGFVVTGLAQVVRLRSRLGTLTRLLAVRSQLALAKFLGHFFTPHFNARQSTAKRAPAEADALEVNWPNAEEGKAATFLVTSLTD